MLDFDRNNFLDHRRFEELHHDAKDQHLLSQRIVKQHHYVVVIEFKHRWTQYRWQRQKYDTGQATFASLSMNLAPNYITLTNQLANFVEDFSKVTTRLALQDDTCHKEPKIEVGHSVCHVAHRIF